MSNRPICEGSWLACTQIPHCLVRVQRPLASIGGGGGTMADPRLAAQASAFVGGITAETVYPGKLLLFLHCVLAEAALGKKPS